MYIVQAGSSHVPDYPSLKYIRAVRDAGPNKSIDLKGGSRGGRLAVAQILAPSRLPPTPSAPHQA